MSPTRLQVRFYGLYSLFLVFSAAGCSDGFGLVFGCEDWTRASLQVQIRDETGSPSAIGTRVIVRKGELADTTFGVEDGLALYPNVFWDGKLKVEVFKPWYQGPDPKHVDVSSDRCGRPKTETVRIRLKSLPNSPPVRQVVVGPRAVYLGDGNVTMQFLATVLADPGMGAGVVWASRDTLVARVDQTGLVTSVCRTSIGATPIVVFSAADTSVRDSALVEVGPASATSGRCPASGDG